MSEPSSRRRSSAVHRLLLGIRDRFYPELAGQPPSAEWVGPMGFTPDQLPAVGFLRPGVIVAAGFNGYGGSYTTAAGQAAAVMALTGESPDWVPEEVFSPLRFLESEPLFLQQHDNLLRIAATLAGQLRLVTHRISDLLLQGATASPLVPADVLEAGSERPRRASPSSGQELRDLPTFSRFASDEMEDLLGYMDRFAVDEGAVLMKAGEPGGTCLVIVEGLVDVTVEVGGAAHLLTTLEPGAIIGEVSLIEDAPRSATCTARTKTVLLELDRPRCESLFATRSPVALKFLEALNVGLIAALRRADRHLMRLEQLH